MTKEQGFTLIELMVAVALLGIVLAIAAPSMSDYIDKRRVINAAEAVYSQFLYARSESVARSETVFVSFSTNGTDTWSVGVSTTPDCDPTVTTVTDATACTMVIDDGDGNIHGDDPDGDGTAITDTDDLVLHVISSTDFPNIIMGNTNDPMGAVAFGGSTQAQFDSTRGVLASGGSVVLRYEADDVTTYDIQLRVALTGRALLCSPIDEGRGVPGYSQCN